MFVRSSGARRTCWPAVSVSARALGPWRFLAATLSLDLSPHMVEYMPEVLAKEGLAVQELLNRYNLDLLEP